MKKTIPFIFLLFSLSYLHVSLATNGTNQEKEIINPFSPKASLIRYWKTKISNKLPIPNFLLSKASPLTPHQYATLMNLLNQKPFSSQFHISLCSSPNLFCSFDNPNQSTITTTKSNSNFAVYSNKRFANYGSSQLGGVDSFKNYSNGLNTNNDSFKKYSTTSTNHGGNFNSYAENGNVANTNFTSYGAGATSGTGDFKSYDKLVNVPNLGFTTYDSAAKNHKRSFSSYGNETNSGSQSFTSYGKRVRNGNSDFTNYAVGSNIQQSTFTSYSELGTGSANDSFTSYSFNGNNPHNSFKNYATGSISGSETFASYRNRANVGDDSFQNYALKSKSGTASFANYGKSFNVGNDTFTEYGKGSTGRTSFGFKSYGLGRAFKGYNKEGASFNGYSNFSAVSGESESKTVKMKIKRVVEPGKFFREGMLKEGNVMVMPDISDKMPVRSFLPLAISSKLPLRDIEKLFQSRKGSVTERVMVNALKECERAPSKDETKRCVGSGEEMIEFAVSVLGSNVVVRTSESVNGSKKRVMIGKVEGGKVSKAVSCHQSMYPYLLYYCHSVPKVRVYEADILDVDTKVKINHGVAICHLDTSAWGQEHGAFWALGSGPGKIEVCHWIFENDMTWTTAN